ncbi:LysR family transcriptional regulator [Methylobacterium sp. ID0610]|uniref:LysR family transcriptional regulator n=1 Tax=Methylobacterium carpenticola TaxID=3344827 RepID=UPI0036841EDD
MDLDWLKDFLALAEQRTFSRAAEARHVTQPAFSRRIRALEDWVGTPLFVRGAQGAVPTPAGAHLQPLAAALVQGLDRARRETRAVGERETAALAVAATHALSFTFFPTWIRRQPALAGPLNLISDSLEACEAIILAGEVQFLLCHTHPEAPPRLDGERFPSRPVGEDLLIPVCAPDAAGAPLWPLPGQPGRPTRRLAYSPASGLGRILAAREAGLTRGAVLITVFTSHLAATLMSMAREGQGLAWLPLTLAEEDLARGRLVRAGAEDVCVPVEIRLFRAAGSPNPAADALWAGAMGEAAPARPDGQSGS